MLTWMQELCGSFLDGLLSLLPLSPFRDAIASLGSLPYLGYLNWFIPIGTMVQIGTAWLIAIGMFYLYSVIARWVKLIS